MSLVIYTKPGCPYCQQAREHYSAKGIAFIDRDALRCSSIPTAIQPFRASSKMDNMFSPDGAIRSAVERCMIDEQFARL